MQQWFTNTTQDWINDTASFVQINSNAHLNSLKINNSNGNISIGLNQNFNSNKLQISTDPLVSITPTLTTSLFEIDSDSSYKSDFTFRLATNETGGSSAILFLKTGGNLSVPGNITNNDILGTISFYGRQTDSINLGANIYSKINGTINTGDTTDLPTKLIFATTPDNTYIPEDRLTITAEGSILVNKNITSPTFITSNSGKITSNSSCSYLFFDNNGVLRDAIC